MWKKISAFFDAVYQSPWKCFVLGIAVTFLSILLFGNIGPISQAEIETYTIVSAVIVGLFNSFFNAVTLFWGYKLWRSKISAENIALIVLGFLLGVYPSYFMRGVPFFFIATTLIVQLALFAYTYQRFVRYVQKQEQAQKEEDPQNK